MATKVTDPNDLLLYKLGVMLKTEKAIERTLPRLQKEANNSELAQGLERHLEQTRRHVSNIEEAFRLLGEKPQEHPSPAIEGLEQEHKGFAQQAADDVWPDVLDMVTAGSVAATEQHEIAGYEALITMARTMGPSELVPLLEENIRDDEQMLRGAEQLAERLAQDVVREAAEATE